MNTYEKGDPSIVEGTKEYFKVKQLAEAGYSIGSIAKLIHTSRRRIEVYFKRFGFVENTNKNQRAPFVKGSEEYNIIKELVDQGVDLSMISRTTGISYHRVYTYVRRFNMKEKEPEKKPDIVLDEKKDKEPEKKRDIVHCRGCVTNGSCDICWYWKIYFKKAEEVTV